jgi:hypothetical protein
MGIKITLAAVATAAAAFCFAPQAASAAPALGDTKQVTKSNVEQAGYRGRRHWRHRHYYRGGYGHRRYYRRPGFGIYLGF